MEISKLAIELKKSKLDGLICKEPINREILNKLRSSDLLKENFHNPFAEYNHSNELQQLTKYEALIDKNDYALVKYNKVKNMPYGRVMPQGALGLFSIRREIRQTLSKNILTDIDIENCHPVLLLQICRDNKIECKYLKKYVDNRSKYLELIQKHYLSHIENKNELKDISKNLFIRMLFLGKYENWFEDFNIVPRDTKHHNDLHYINKFIKKFQDELDVIAESINNANPDLVKLVKKRKVDQKNGTHNLKGSVMSYFLQEYENQILECMYMYCVKNKYIVDNICVLCADGFMIETKNFKIELLENLKNEILNKTGFKVNVTEKPMNQDYLDILNDHIIKPLLDPKSYEGIKQSFEEHSFKIMNPISFGTQTKDGELILRNKSDFYTAYENVLHETAMERKDRVVIKDESFILNWLKDSQIRTYDKIDFLPMLIAPKNIFNTFTGYKAKKIVKTTNIDIKTTKIYEHLKNLCNNEIPVIEYVLAFLSRKLQQPHRLTNTALLFRSIEGCGKDTFFNWFGNSIMGKKYYLNTDVIDDIFGKFNTGIHNKIVIVINETDGRQTKELDSVMKNAITRDINIIQYKSMTPFENVNTVGYIFLTNQQNSIKIPIEDRRYCAIQCNNDIANNYEYFKLLREEMENEQINRAFYDYFMGLDVINYDFTGNRPKTEYYNDMKENNIPVVVRFFEFLFEQNIDDNDKLIKNVAYPATQLFHKFEKFIELYKYKYDCSLTKFCLELKNFKSTIQKNRTTKGVFYAFDLHELKKFLISKNYIED